MANCSSFEKLPEQSPKDADMKQILKQDLCFSPWSSSGPSKATFTVTFSKKKSYPPPSIFAFYLFKETYPETSKAALEWSLALYCAFRQKGKMFKSYPAIFTKVTAQQAISLWTGQNSNGDWRVLLTQKQKVSRMYMKYRISSSSLCYGPCQDNSPPPWRVSQWWWTQGRQENSVCSMSKSFYMKSH